MKEPDQSKLGDLTRALSWIFVPLSILLLDFEFRYELNHSVFAFPWLLFGSTAISFVFWWGITKLLSGRLRWALPIVVLVLGLGVCLTWGGIHAKFFSVSPQEVIYLLEEPGNAISLVFDAWSWKVSLGFIAIVMLWSFALLHSATKSTTTKIRALAGTGVLASVIYVAFLPTIFEMPWTPYPSDVRSAYVVWEGVGDYLSGRRSITIGTAKRSTPEPLKNQSESAKKEKPSILLIVGESLRFDHMSAFSNYPRKTTPKLDAFLNEHPDETFLFERHLPNAAATFWATTGIFLGRYPGPNRKSLREAPAIWQYAKSVGYSTFIVTSQSWAWANFRKLWLDPGPDYFQDAESLGLPIINDTGGDDLLAAKELAAELSRDTFSSPFFGVFQTNSTHWPFVESPHSIWTEPNDVDIFDSATLRTDESIGLLLDALKQNGRLENTIVILTSDHAEILDHMFAKEDQKQMQKYEPGILHGARVGSCEPVFANAPLTIFIPKKWQEKTGIDLSALKENRNKVSSHTDIFPTVLDVIGYPKPDGLDGQSLLDPVPSSRIAYCFTTPLWANTEISAVGARQGDRYAYLRANASKVYFYDLSLPDAFQRRALLPPFAGSEKYLEEVKTTFPFPSYLSPIMGNKITD